MLTRHRAVGIALGLLTFTITHVVLVTHWSTWFHGSYEPWFLNTASAGKFTFACLVGAGVVAGVFNVFGGFVLIGAVIAMIVVMFASGPGTLWPIVIVVGGSFFAVAIGIGNLIGFGIRRVVSSTRA